jgi:solute carrier family 35 protein
MEENEKSENSDKGMQKVEVIENENDNHKEEKSQKSESNKTYLNLGCCKINVGLIFTYIYIFTGALLNVINRIIFYNYNFRFNFTFAFLQQIMNLFLFTCVGNHSETFIKHAGKISFSNFYQFRYHYFLFTVIFAINILINFYGNQLVKNVSMFLSLRKFNAVMLFIVDFFIGKKKIDFITILCIFLITGGSFIINSDTFSKDYLGYVVVLINNLATISSSKYSEVFRKKTGDSNLKLLIYNAYIINPLLFACIFITGEHKRLYQYFSEENSTKIEGTFLGLFFYLFLSCFFSVILNSSFFISNEKTSSLMTNLLTNTKSIFISAALYLFDKKKNKLTFKMVFGLGMATVGAVFITSHSFWNNLKCNKKEDMMEQVKIKDNEEKK